MICKALNSGWSLHSAVRLSLALEALLRQALPFLSFLVHYILS